MKKNLLLFVILSLSGSGLLFSQAYVDTVAFGALASEAKLFGVPEFPFELVNGSEFPVPHDFTFAAGELNSTETVDVDVKLSFVGNKLDNDTREVIDSTVYLNWRDNKYFSISPWPSEDSPGRENGDYRQMNFDEMLTIIFDSVNNTPPNDLYPPVQMSLAGIGAWGSALCYVDVLLNGELVGTWIPEPSKVRLVTPILTDPVTRDTMRIVITEGDTLQLKGKQASSNPDYSATYYRLVGFMMIMENTLVPTSVSLTAEGGTAEITEINGSLRILEEVLPADASDKRIIWSIDDKGTGATINTGGVLQALPRQSGNGTVTVTGTLAGNPAVSGTIDVLISGQLDIPVNSIIVRGAGGADSISFNGGSLQMIAEVFPEIAADRDVEWSVEDNGTGATIDADGLLQAKATNSGNGTVIVKATAKDGSGVSGTIDVIIKNQSGIYVEFISLSHEGDFPEIIENKGTLQLYAEVLPSNASDRTINWTVEDNGTGATIDQTGLLSAAGSENGNGSVTVFATAVDGSGVRDSIDVVIMGQVASIHDARAAKAISIFPNPVNDGQSIFIEVNNDAYSIESINIFKYTGQKIASYEGFSAGTRQAEVSIDDNAGIYLLRINTNDGQVIKRILKIQ